MEETEVIPKNPTIIVVISIERRALWERLMGGIGLDRKGFPGIDEASVIQGKEV